MNHLLDSDIRVSTSVFYDGVRRQKFMRVIPFIRRGSIVKFYLRCSDDVVLDAMPLMFSADTDHSYQQATTDFMDCYRQSKFFGLSPALHRPLYMDAYYNSLCLVSNVNIYYMFVNVDGATDFVKFLNFAMQTLLEVTECHWFSMSSLNEIYRQNNYIDYHCLAAFESYLITGMTHISTTIYQPGNYDYFLEVEVGETVVLVRMWDYDSPSTHYHYFLQLFSREEYNLMSNVLARYRAGSFNAVGMEIQHSLSLTPIASYERIRLLGFDDTDETDSVSFGDHEE